MTGRCRLAKERYDLPGLPLLMSFRPDRGKLRERGGGLLFAILFNLLLLLALFTLAPELPVRKIDDRMPVSFDMDEGRQDAEQTKAQKSETREKQKSAEAPPPAAQPVVRPPREVVKPPEQPPSPFPFLTLNRDQMAASDIGKMEGKTGAAGAETQGPALAQGPGEGPGGVQLYPAEWYREPTDAEIGAYRPAGSPGNGWGEVACKTIERYHVENCQQLGESPLGSGYARAVRQAAWQFQVLPPRVNGKPQVGAWVRIRITYTTRMVNGPG